MNAIGIDIGSNSVKAVELVKKGDKVFLKSYAISPSTTGEINSKSSVDTEVIAEIIKKTWDSLKTKNRNIALAIDQSSVFTRVLEMPQMSDVELASSINWEAESYIPLPVNQVRFEWQIMRRYENQTGQKRMDVLLIAVPRTLIDTYYKLVSLSNLDLKILEPESISIMRTLSLFKLNETLNVIVNFGESKTDIIVNSFGSISFVRSLPSGGKALTRAISKNLEIPEEQAENYKVAYGFDQTKINGAVYATLMPIFQSVIDEIRRAIAFQQNKDATRKISTIVLCGGGSNLPDMNIVLSTALNLEVFAADPFSVITPSDKNVKISSAVNQRFLVAVGLAMAEIT